MSQRAYPPRKLTDFMAGVGWDLLWYVGDWWYIRFVDWRSDTSDHLVPGPYRLRVILVNLHNHSQTFEFPYDPDLEHYCDGNRKGYRIMPPASHNCDPTDRRFWIVVSRLRPGDPLTLPHSSEFKSEATAIEAAEASARCAPGVEFFVVESVTRTAYNTLITERLRRC